jgi:hypothetical protein
MKNEKKAGFMQLKKLHKWGFGIVSIFSMCFQRFPANLAM